MFIYGKTGDNTKWHFLDKNYNALCSSNLIIQKKLMMRMLKRPDNLCSRCESHQSKNLSKETGNNIKSKNSILSLINLKSQEMEQQTYGNIKLLVKMGDMRDIRRDLWLRYYQDAKSSGVCHTCHKEITYLEYHPGKILSKDSNSLTNNRPLCKNCFYKMGNKDMDLFQKNTFPEQYDSVIRPMDIEWYNDYIISDSSSKSDENL